MSAHPEGTTRRPPPSDVSAPGLNPYLGLVLATIAVSTSAILIRESTAPPLTLAAYRLAITTAILLPLLRPARLARLRALSRKGWGLVGLAGGLLALHFAFWTASLSYTSVASSVLFVSIHPALVAAIGVPLLGERLSRRAGLGIALTLVGGALIAGSDLHLSERALRGDGLAVLGAVVFAGYLVIGRGIREQLDTVSYSTPVYGLAALILAALSFPARQSLLAVGGRDILVFVLLALIPTLGGHLIYNWTLRHLPAAVVSVSFLGEPVGAALLAWPILGEVPPVGTVAVGTVVLAGIWLTLRR